MDDPEGRGHRSKVTRCDCFTDNVEGQQSHGSRSKVAWLNSSLKVIILANGFTLTSSC